MIVTTATIATLAALSLGGSTVDIVKGTNYIETIQRVICVKTMDAKWINKHTPQAKCVPNETE